jgi:hypothetical protein
MHGMQHLGFIAVSFLGIGGSIVGRLIRHLSFKLAPGSAFMPPVQLSHSVMYGDIHLNTKLQLAPNV